MEIYEPNRNVRGYVSLDNEAGYTIKKFCHWGPITAIVIIQTITLTTLYMNSMWWPPNKSFEAFLHQSVFLALSGFATFNFVMATSTGPGFLDRKWRPKYDEDAAQMQFCKVCEGYKAPRSHHCRKCNRCVKKMDHHCPWINNCVGWANHAYFIYFLFYSICGSLHATVVLTCSFYRGVYRYWYLTHNQFHLANVQFNMISIIFCIFAMGLAIGVVIALSMLLYFQMKSVVNNMTAIEIWIVEKALYRRHNNPNAKRFVYPYDLGWVQNILNVFQNHKIADGLGLVWPVVNGCHQFTLTREQIAQKQEKRARTKTFKCIRPATGSYVPLFSQGWQVCLSPPCTDEPRIRLAPDDIIKVTRFRRHWLFGERCPREGVDSQRVLKEEIRGWFPRRCAVELIEVKAKPTGRRRTDDDSVSEDSTGGSTGTGVAGAAYDDAVENVNAMPYAVSKKQFNGNVKKPNGQADKKKRI